MDNELPEDDVPVPKHVGAILMLILILFLRQSLVQSLVNKKTLIISSCTERMHKKIQSSLIKIRNFGVYNS
jgi:hypothetical protein